MLVQKVKIRRIFTSANDMKDCTAESSLPPSLQSRLLQKYSLNIYSACIVYLFFEKNVLS